MKIKNRNKMEWIYLFAVVLLILLTCRLFSSCEVIKTNYSNEAKKEATVYYYLPESVIKIKATAKVAVVYNADTLVGKSKLIEESFVITSEIIADTKNLLALNYIPNIFMADDIKYGVNSKGLLETVNITTEDKTTDIITKLAEAPKAILGFRAFTDEVTTTTVKIKEITADFEIKASAITSSPQKINWNLLIFNELGVDGDFETVQADFSVSSTDTVDATNTLAAIIGAADSKNEINGILTRPIKNISLKIESATDTNTNPVFPSNVVVADVTKLIVVPVKRTAFVKRINKIGIQDGIILSNEINKPSSVEGFASIPINIAKAIVSIPAQLIQFKIDNTKRAEDLEKAKLSLEKSIQDSQKFALMQEQEIENVKLEIKKNGLSNSVELQKLKLELQTSLLEAEKRQFDAQKALDEIKKQLDELMQKK